MKTIQQVKDIRDIKGMQAVSMRSLPKAHRSGYLKLYTFATEKDRLEKDMFALDKRKNGIQKRLAEINKWMKELREATSGGQKTRAVKNIIARAVKTLPVKY